MKVSWHILQENLLKNPELQEEAEEARELLSNQSKNADGSDRKEVLLEQLQRKLGNVGLQKLFSTEAKKSMGEASIAKSKKTKESKKALQKNKPFACSKAKKTESNSKTKDTIAPNSQANHSKYNEVKVNQRESHQSEKEQPKTEKAIDKTLSDKAQQAEENKSQEDRGQAIEEIATQSQAEKEPLENIITPDEKLVQAVGDFINQLPEPSSLLCQEIANLFGQLSKTVQSRLISNMVKAIQQLSPDKKEIFSRFIQTLSSNIIQSDFMSRLLAELLKIENTLEQTAEPVLDPEPVEDE